MAATRTTITSRLEHAVKPQALRSYFAEFLSTFFYVFAATGSSISARRMMLDTALGTSSLVAMAMSNAFALSVAVYIAANISGGHVNPAVTFGRVVGGHISIPMSIFYWISQLLGSVFACAVFRAATAGQHVPTHTIASEMTGFGALILEGIMTFALVYTVYAASDSRHGLLQATGPLAIGLISGANILASGPFTGGSMNPAYSFGSALVGGSFKNQAVYWVGPLIGGAVAGILYDNVVFPSQMPPPPESPRRSGNTLFNGVLLCTE